MKKIFSGIMLFMLLFVTNVAQAQETERELTREEKKAMQAKLDSLLFEEAKQTLNNKQFTLEADQVVFKYGQTAYVNSNTNFVSVDGENAVVQVAFNIPISGPNGLGGVTVDGKVSSYEVKTDKRGNLHLSMNVMGVGISARVDIDLMANSNNAVVNILPNFNSNRLTLNGTLLPLHKSNVFKGRSI